MGYLDRKYKRKPISQPCWLEVAGQRDLLPGFLEDVSVGGARIRVGIRGKDLLPDRFVLRLSQFQKCGRLCAVRRREPEAVGVEFLERG